MNENERLDAIRTATLHAVDRTERHYKLAFFGAAALEGAFLAAYLLLADLANRTHVLLLLAAVATYTIVILAMLALGAHVTRNTLRVLKAMDARD